MGKDEFLCLDSPGLPDSFKPRLEHKADYIPAALHYLKLQ